jgi:hypothetical protein
MSIVIACAATSAYASPAKTTAVQCKIAGQPLALGEVHDALVATPNGRIVVLAGDGRLHAYRPRAGSACVLDVDRTFGKDGVVDSRIGSDFSAARLEVDSSGTLYASSGQKQMQVVGTKVTPMCGEGLVAASPRSVHVWRWFAINAVTRASGSCEGGKQFDLSPDDSYIGEVYAVDDDRLVVVAGTKMWMVNGDGTSPVRLLDKLDEELTPVRFVPCGGAVCELSLYSLATWSAKGERLSSVEMDSLIKLSAPAWVGFTVLGKTGYALANIDGRGVIVRVDGIPGA